MKLFWLNPCRVETLKSIINIDITIELKSFVFKILFKINNKINSSTAQVRFPLLLMLNLDKKLSFIKHLYFSRNSEVIKTANKVWIMTLIIKAYRNCKINWFSKFRKSRVKILLIVNFVKKNLTLRFAYKSKIIWNIQKQKQIMKRKVLRIQKAECSNLNTTVMHKHQNTKLDWYLPFPRFLLSSWCW